MANSNEEKFRRFHHALVQAPEYFGIATKDRRACTNFASLAARLDSKSPPAQDELDAAFGPALQEARKFATQGLLTIDLSEFEPMLIAETTKGVAEKAADSDPLAKYSIHPAAAMFPLMDEQRLDELAADIRENELQQPIVRYKGQVIDGRNRLIGCFRAGVEPTFTEWSGTGSLIQWIISVNLHRRHLSDTQRALISAKIAQELAVEGRQRSIQNLRNAAPAPDNLDPGPRNQGGSSAEKAAKLMSVSKDATSKATKVMRKGTEGLAAAVSNGKVSLDAASLISELPREKQDELLSKGNVREVSQKLRESKKLASKGKVQNPGAAEATTTIGSTVAPSPSTVRPKSESVDQSRKASAAAEPDVPKSKVAFDGLPLVKKLHESIDGMVTAARIAGTTTRLESALQRMIEFSDKSRVSFESASAV